MRRVILAVALGAMLAAALTACGRKGKLEPPPQSAIEAPGEAVAG